ncbi:MAG TPA: hypothetical protein VGI36_06420, partial [Candidatus Binataceae bacterium]
YLDEAQRLRPDSWNYRRQALSLKDPTNPLAVAARSSRAVRLNATRPELDDTRNHWGLIGVRVWAL